MVILRISEDVNFQFNCQLYSNQIDMLCGGSRPKGDVQKC